MTAAAGTGFVSSGDINLPFSSGVVYGLGVGWSCEADYYGETCARTCAGIDAGIGYFEDNCWSNSYAGFSSTVSPTDHGTGSLARYQNAYIRP